MAAAWAVSQSTKLGLITPHYLIANYLYANMAMMMDSVPPELQVPQCFPSSFLNPMKSAVIAMISVSICFTKGNVSQ